MHELTRKINARRTEGQPALLPYLMAGDGGFEKTEALLNLYEACGADAVEIGIPFSDPVADGPSIQAAGLRSLGNGTTLQNTLEWLAALPPSTTPRIVMCYLNPILRMGTAEFFQAAALAGVSAVIIPDLPLEEMPLCSAPARDHGVPLIPLVAPATGQQRLQQILQQTDGFIYAVTVNGVTGARNGFGESVAARLSMLRQQTELPVIAGFGISSPEQVLELKAHCDGFVIGSALVDRAHRQDFDGIRQFFEAARSAR